MAVTVWMIACIVSLPVSGRRKASVWIYALIGVISGYLLGATGCLASIRGLGTRLIVVCLVPGWDYVFRRFELHCAVSRTEPSAHFIRDISELAIWLVAPETTLIPVILHRKHAKVITKRSSETNVVKLLKQIHSRKNTSFRRKHVRHALRVFINWTNVEGARFKLFLNQLRLGKPGKCVHPSST